MSIISEFYKRLRDLCEERSMTVNELVKILDLASGSPTAWKNGTIPRDTTLVKIADYLGVTTEYLKGKTSKKAPTPDGEHDILDDVDIAFYSTFKGLSEAGKETLRAMARVLEEQEAKDNR